MGCVLGGLVGAAVGLVVGAVVSVVLYYLVEMLPNHVPLEFIDQGGAVVVWGGPVGAIIGAPLAGLAVRRSMSRRAR
jgi:hypothetical protein